MILRDRPGFLQLFLVMRGSVVPRILGNLVGVTLLALAAMLTDRFLVPLPHLSLSVLGTFGAALSLFLGFRNNAAYDRWWEARKLWGAMVADARSLARDLAVFGLPVEAREQALTHLVAFVHFHRGGLRGRDAVPEVTPWIGAEAAARFAAAANPADAVLRRMGADLGAATEDGFARRALAARLASLGLLQAGGERILATPMPFVYGLLMRRTTWIYCLLLPFGLLDTGDFAPVYALIVAYVLFGLATVTEELEHPFRDVVNGLPLDALCRTIEISVAEALNRPAPPPLAPVDHLLT